MTSRQGEQVLSESDSMQIILRIALTEEQRFRTGVYNDAMNSTILTTARQAQARAMNDFNFNVPSQYQD